MTTNNLVIMHSHLCGKCDITQNDEFVYTIGGGDNLINKIDKKTHKMIDSTNSKEIYHSIHINMSNPDHLILAGSSKVDLIKNNDFENPYYLIKSFGSVYRLASDLKFIACVGDENEVNIYDKITEKNYKTSKAHEAGCINLAFQKEKSNEESKFFCSTSADGYLNVFSLEKNDDKYDIRSVKNIKISKEISSLEQVLKPNWNNSGNILGIPGSSTFSYLIYNNGVFTLHSESKIIHEAEISLIYWISDSILITVGLDKQIKVWDYTSKKMIASCPLNDCIQNLIYDTTQDQIIFIDGNGQLGFWSDPIFKSSPSELISKSEIEIKPDQPLTEIKTVSPNIEIKPEEKDSSEFTKKKTYIKSDADTWIDAPPQMIVHSSSTSMFKSRRFLCWNLIGTIIIRKDNEYSFLDIDFSDKNFHKNIRTRDIYNVTMGTMNYMGALMASKPDAPNENEYENELEKDENKKYSFLQYKCFTYNYEPYDWVYKLQETENVEALCLGSFWCAASTDFNFIRIFNLVGIEINVLACEKPIVCMSGYENLLGYVVHDSVPLFGIQNLKLQIIDINKMKIIHSCMVPITPYSTLTWFGFSQEGLLILQESSGIIKAYFNDSIWITLYDINNDDLKMKKKFWLVGMVDYELIGVILGKDELEPTCYPLPQTKIIEICLPFIKNQDNKGYEKILWKKLVLEHEKYRKKNWFGLKMARDKNNNLAKYSDNILSESEISKMEMDIEKLYVDYFREFLIKGEYEKGISVVSTMIKQIRTIEICLVLCNKLNLQKIGEKINDLLIEKKKKIEYDSFNDNNGNAPVDISNFQNIQNINNVQKKNKIGLSDLAVQKQTSITMAQIQQKSKKILPDFDVNDLENYSKNEIKEKIEDKKEKKDNENNIVNPFSHYTNTEEPKNLLDLIDSKKKRKMVEEDKVVKKLKYN